ncbi:MAG: protoporphyrinogen oxidase, partial [Oscillochloris sp.]|nr:protoporphyrinogen oxidase [Oscillochloris sp.]
MLDCGPNTLSTKIPRLWNEFADLGIADRIVGTGRIGKRRFILHNGVPTEIPSSLPAMVRTPLLSPLAKLRMLAEPFIPRGGGDEESIASFFSRRIGAEPVANLIDPFVSGVYSGNPSAMSVKSYFGSLWEAERRGGSIVRGMLKGRNKSERGAIKEPKMRSVIFGFRNGLAEWPQAIARALGAGRVWTQAPRR